MSTDTTAGRMSMDTTPARYTAAHWGTYTIADDGLHPVADDPAPALAGQGWLSAARDEASRILFPAARKGWLDGDGGAARASDGLVRIGWDEAASLAAREVARVREAHGNGAIFAGSYGWSSAGRFHHAQSQLRRFLNLAGGFVFSRETYSHAAAEVMFPHLLGLSYREVQDQTTTWDRVSENAELVVAFGGMGARSAQITSSGVVRHDQAAWLRGLGDGPARINISPRRGDLDDAPGAEWLPIRPGTDVGLMLALCHALLDARRQDEAFLVRCTSGWPRFRAYLTGETDGTAKSAEWASPICDIPAESIRALAARMADARTMINVAWSLQRADHGEQPIWAGLALAAMLGQIGQPGCGFTFGYGSMGPVGRPMPLLGWPSLPQGRNAVDDFIPVARIADMLLHPGEPYSYDGTVRTYPDIRLVWWAGGNPFHHHQDLARLEDAWTRPETVIVQDHAWTATARRADLVLPATTPLERHDVMMNRREPTLVAMSPAMPPMGEALDDHEILRRIAAEMGLEEAFTEGRTVEDWLRHLWEGAREVAAAQGHALPDYETFRETGRVDLPVAPVSRDLLAGFVADPDANPLDTETGRIPLFSETIAGFGLGDCPGHPAWLEPVEGLHGAAPDLLHLLSGQPANRLHAQNDRGARSQADKLRGREVAWVHPDAAAARGLSEGDIVLLSSARGACLAGLRLEEGLRPDCIVLPTGAWYDPQDVGGRRIDVHGNPNALTIDKGTSGLAQGNIAHTTLVRVERWDRPLPPLTVDAPPPFVER